jgi:hypothetical protein
MQIGLEIKMHIEQMKKNPPKYHVSSIRLRLAKGRLAKKLQFWKTKTAREIREDLETRLLSARFAVAEHPNSLVQ